MQMSGVINVDKPAGLTSARVVDRVKRLLPRGTKVGHAGTLDPFATGVLLVLVGKGTKSCERLMGARKGYEAGVKLGARTATDDVEGVEEHVAGAGVDITVDGGQSTTLRLKCISPVAFTGLPISIPPMTVILFN